MVREEEREGNRNRAETDSSFSPVTEDMFSLCKRKTSTKVTEKIKEHRPQSFSFSPPGTSSLRSGSRSAKAADTADIRNISSSGLRCTTNVLSRIVRVRVLRCREYGAESKRGKSSWYFVQ